VTISAGGTTAVLVSEETGRQIGGLEDLAKLLGLRSFVTKEKKASASSELQEEILTAAFRASAKAAHDDPTFVQKKLDNSFVLAAKPYKALVDIINDKTATLNGNYHEGSSEYKTLLRAYCSRITDAAGRVLTEMVKGNKEKGLMDASLLELGVPTYVRNKLQLKSLAITKDMDLSRILFPQDPSKGLSLTIAEWRSKDFVQKQGRLMINSEPIIRIIQDDELFLELIGMSAAEFQNAEDPRVQRVMKSRILVVPPFEDHKRVLEPLSRSNFRGFGLPNTAMDQSKDRLSNLCAVFVRAYAFSVRMAETIPDFYDRITPAGTIKAPDEKLGNYAKQLLDAQERGVETSLLPKLRLKESTAALMAWIDRECKIIPEGDLHKQINSVLTKGGAGSSVYEPSVPGDVLKTITPGVDMVSPISTGAEKDAYKSFRQDALSLKEKTSKGRKNTMASSVLSKNAKTFLKHVSKEHSPMLAQSMEAYFRGFYSEAIQAAAVRIAEARFDDLEEVSDLDVSSDAASDEEDSDDES
jgi:gas vesicle protein